MHTMNRAFALCVALMLACAIVVPAAVAAAVPTDAEGDAVAVAPAEADAVATVSYEEPTDTPKEVQLTDKQRRELATLYKDILKKERKVVATYVKFGVITKEQGKMINSHLDQRYLKLEQNGFIPHWGKYKDKHKHHDHKHHDHKHHDHKHRDQ